MKIRRALLLGLLVAMAGVFAAPASAQDGPTLTAEPATVEAAGEQEFTITGTDWTLSPLFVLPCPAPESGDAADVDAAACDTANVTSVSALTDGGFEITVTYDVPEGGLAIAATDAGQAESVATVVTIGAAAADDGGDDAADDGGEDEGLANTGAESGLIAIIGLAVLAAGAMVVGTTRRS